MHPKSRTELKLGKTVSVSVLEVPRASNSNVILNEWIKAIWYSVKSLCEYWLGISDDGVMQVEKVYDVISM